MATKRIGTSAKVSGPIGTRKKALPKKPMVKDDLLKIKSCPFCFNTDMGVAYFLDDSVTVSCRKCGTNGPWSTYEIGAIERWNKRK
jgi:ribosomal protein S27E